MSQSKSNVLPIVLGVIIALLLVLNAFLLANRAKQNNTIAQQTVKLTESQEMLDELQAQYDEAITELDQVSADNEDLRAQVEEQKSRLNSELRRAKSRVRELTENGQANEAALEEARLTIANFTTQKDSFLGEINTLKEQNQVLEEANVGLKLTTDTLKMEVAEKVEENTKLEEAKEKLKEEKKDLVAKGSVLVAHTIKANGVMSKKKKGEVATDVAKKSDKVQVCFTLAENQIAKAGQTVVYLRLVNPLGETEADESKGSGFIDDPKSGEAVRFTISEPVDYDNSATDVCLDWTPAVEFIKGKYVAEIYNKSHKIGTKEFSLR